MAKRKKTIIAGNHIEVCIYTMQYPRDTTRARAAKSKMSSAARKAMNYKASRKKCRLKVLTNFSNSDIFLTLTYDDIHLPANRRDANNNIKYFIRKLRSVRKKHGEELKYVYVTENEHSGRLHHHMIINSTGKKELDIDLFNSLWIFGDEINIEFLGKFGIAHYCDYITKERDTDKKVGARMWTPSRNLIQPTEINEIVPDNETAKCPPNAVIIERDEKQNEFGEYIYIAYELLPDDNRPIRPTWRKRKSE